MRQTFRSKGNLVIFQRAPQVSFLPSVQMKLGLIYFLSNS